MLAGLVLAAALVGRRLTAPPEGRTSDRDLRGHPRRYRRRGAWTRAGRRMRWRPLLLTSWLAVTGWTLCLVLIDGYRDGIVARLSSTEEYLHDVPQVNDIPTMLAGFTDH